MSYVDALPAETRRRPAYRIEILEGTVSVPKFAMTEEGMKETVVEEEAGFMVHFYNGHSIRIKDRKGLLDLGLDQRTVALLDDSDGEPVEVGHVPLQVTKGGEAPKSPLDEVLGEDDD